MKIFCIFSTVNISKLLFRLVICIAKNFFLTTLKAIFSICRFFLHPQIPEFQIVVSQILSYVNKPYTNGKLIHSAFRRHLKIEKLRQTGFVVQGHICLAVT